MTSGTTTTSADPGSLVTALEPGPMTWSSSWSAWDLDPAAAALVLALLGGYLAAVRALRRRGHGWPTGRTVTWVSGVAVSAAVTLGVLGAYDEQLVWPDVTQHVLLGLLVPVLLAFGLPVTLAVKTASPRSLRRLRRVLRSRAAAVVANPLVAFTVLMAVLVVPYPAGGYATALDHPAVHEGWHAAVLVAGCLLFWPLLGLEPVPGRVPHLLRQALLLASLPVYVVVGLAVLNSDTGFAAEHFARLDRGWGPDPVADQRIGGAVFAWVGNALSILYGFVLLIVWMRDDGVRSRRLDRDHDRLVAAGRDADTELARYNAWLAGLRTASPPGTPPTHAPADPTDQPEEKR